MSSQAVSLHAMPSLRSLPLARWGVLCALLFVEVMFLTVRFDTIALYQMQGWWADLMGESWIIPQVCVAVTAALLLFSGNKCASSFNASACRACKSITSGAALAIQVTVYLAFANVTGITAGWAYSGICSPRALGPALGRSGGRDRPHLASHDSGSQTVVALARARLGPVAGRSRVGRRRLGAGRVTKELWRPLSEVTLWLVHSLLSLVTTDVVHNPAHLHPGHQQVLGDSRSRLLGL